jgi:hypothetical protein
MNAPREVTTRTGVGARVRGGRHSDVHPRCWCKEVEA